MPISQESSMSFIANSDVVKRQILRNLLENIAIENLTFRVNEHYIEQLKQQFAAPADAEANSKPTWQAPLPQNDEALSQQQLFETTFKETNSWLLELSLAVQNVIITVNDAIDTKVQTGAMSTAAGNAFKQSVQQAMPVIVQKLLHGAAQNQPRPIKEPEYELYSEPFRESIRSSYEAVRNTQSNDVAELSRQAIPTAEKVEQKVFAAEQTIRFNLFEHVAHNNKYNPNISKNDVTNLHEAITQIELREALQLHTVFQALEGMAANKQNHCKLRFFTKLKEENNPISTLNSARRIDLTR